MKFSSVEVFYIDSLRNILKTEKKKCHRWVLLFYQFTAYQLLLFGFIPRDHKNSRFRLWCFMVLKSAAPSACVKQIPLLRRWFLPFFLSACTKTDDAEVGEMKSFDVVSVRFPASFIADSSFRRSAAGVCRRCIRAAALLNRTAAYWGVVDDVGGALLEFSVVQKRPLADSLLVGAGCRRWSEAERRSDGDDVTSAWCRRFLTGGLMTCFESPRDRWSAYCVCGADWLRSRLLTQRRRKVLQKLGRKWSIEISSSDKVAFCFKR